MRHAAQQVMKNSEREIATQSLSSLFVAFATTAAAIPAGLAATFRKRKAIAHLRQLDDRLLGDIGLKRSEVLAAVSGELHRKR